MSTSTSPVGLAAATAAALLAETGPNRLPEPPTPGLAHRTMVQLRDPLIVLLLAAMALAVALGDASDATVIALVVVLNTAVGVAQEVRAERALAALRRMSAPATRALRSGEVVRIPAEDVVPGDVILLDAGDIVPADGDLHEAYALLVDEALVTGESVPVGKGIGDAVLAGTVVTSGRGTATVTRTGEDSTLGRIAAQLRPVRRPTPLQRRLTSLGRVLALAAILLSALVAVIALVQGRQPGEAALAAVSLAVAAVPESLPAVVALALALGAHRMARRGAVVRSLPAVETLGSVTVIAVDKTGTLTEGNMVVRALWTPDAGERSVGGTGYEPVGVISGGVTPGIGRLLRDGALCNDASLRRPDDEHRSWWGMGDPTELALLAVAAKGGSDERDRHPRVDEEPFDARRRRMTTTHSGPDGPLVVCKGAPEVVLGPVGSAGSDPLVDAAVHAANTFTAAGARVLAVADGPTSEALTVVGLFAIVDPPRAAAAEVISQIQAAGVRTVMITGDHPTTAAAIAAQVGIAGPGARVVTGDQLDGEPGPADVYARTRPEQKSRIVDEWQHNGDVVAMTGDGVNDAPALRRADIGVAMGGAGTEVARQAADLVLTDDDLGTVVAAIAEGRRVYANIRTFLRYALAGGVAEILVMLCAPLMGLGLPLLPAQILWINLLTHGLPGVAIGAEPVRPGVMRGRIRHPDEFILGDGLWRRIGWTGGLITVVTLAVGWWAHETGRPWQSMVFVSLGLAQLGVAVALRAPGRPRVLDAAVAVAVLLQLAGAYLPPLRELLGTEPLGWADLSVVALVALVPAVAVRLAQRDRADGPRRRRPWSAVNDRSGAHDRHRNGATPE